MTESNKCGNCSEECIDHKRHGNVLIYRCDNCNRRSHKSIDVLIERCSNVYSICNGDLDKFLLLLRKSVIPMITWIDGQDLMK